MMAGKLPIVEATVMISRSIGRKVDGSEMIQLRDESAWGQAFQPALCFTPAMELVDLEKLLRPKSDEWKGCPPILVG
jgi:hypothetical protein